MQVVVDIPNVPIQDYQDLYYKIHGMAASEGLFDDKEKSQRAIALKAVLDVLNGVVNGTPLPKGHGDLIDRDYLAVTPIDATDLPTDKCLMVYCAEEVDDAPIILPADKEGD